MTVLDTEGCGEPQAPPPPPPPVFPTSPAKSTPVSSICKAGNPDTNLLLADIRNGITLKPTKTKDKSTPTFIKRSNGIHTAPPSPHLHEHGHDTSAVDEVKDALQEELRNTLKRKVKKQHVEMGDCTKKDEIEKAIEVNRTEVQLKVNTSAKTSPNFVRKDVVDKTAVKSNTLPRAFAQSERAGHGRIGILQSPFLQRPPAKPARLFNTKPAEDLSSESTALGDNVPGKQEQREQSPVKNAIKPEENDKNEPREQSPVKAVVKPFENGKIPLNGTLKKVDLQKELKIDVNTYRAGTLKNTILSPEVKSGFASIRPSQIKTLTQQGSHVSHNDIVQDPKPVNKSPVMLVEPPKPFYSPPTPKDTSPPSSGQSSPRTPSRTTILDTKISYGIKTTPPSPKIDPKQPPQKLLIAHPRANFTLGRYNSKKNDTPVFPTETKPVFRILTNLEQEERREAEKEQANKKPLEETHKVTGGPGAEPVLTSYVSFAKELSNAPNKYPDTVTKTVGTNVVREDLFFESTNLRDIKIDIVENGRLRVVNK